MLALVCQASIGIVTLLYDVPLGAALAHQGVAMIVLWVATLHRCGLRRAFSGHREGVVTHPSDEIIGLPAFAAGRRAG